MPGEGAVTLMFKRRPGCRLLPGQLSKWRDLLQVGVGQQPWDHYPEGSAWERG